MTSDIEYVILLTSGAQDLFCIRQYITMFSGIRVKTLLSDGSIYDVKNHLMVKKYAQAPSVIMRTDFFVFRKGGHMENKRIAVAAIVIDEQDAAVEVNKVLHEHSDIIIGRMGIPYKERGISLISVALDAEPDVISSLTGRLGQISGVSVKAAISKK